MVFERLKRLLESRRSFVLPKRCSEGKRNAVSHCGRESGPGGPNGISVDGVFCTCVAWNVALSGKQSVFLHSRAELNTCGSRPRVAFGAFRCWGHGHSVLSCVPHEIHSLLRSGGVHLQEGSSRETSEGASLGSACGAGDPQQLPVVPQTPGGQHRGCWVFLHFTGWKECKANFPYCLVLCHSWLLLFVCFCHQIKHKIRGQILPVFR